MILRVPGEEHKLPEEAAIENALLLLETQHQFEVFREVKITHIIGICDERERVLNLLGKLPFPSLVRSWGDIVECFWTEELDSVKEILFGKALIFDVTIKSRGERCLL